MRPALLINGSVGVGKTSTADRIAMRWWKGGVAGAMIDLDAIRYAWPTPADDPFNHRLTITNLASLAASFRGAGHERLVLSGVVEDAEQRADYAAAIAGELIMVRLRGSAELIGTRIRARHGDDHESRDWHLRRHPELEAVLDAAALDDHVVQVDGRTIEEVATEVLALAYPDETSAAVV